MIIVVPREIAPGETRAALTPESVARLRKLGAELRVESGLGHGCDHADQAYAAVGATVIMDREAALAEADLVLRVNKPPLDEIALMKRGALHISHLEPFKEHALLDEFARCDVDAIAMEMIPRTTLAQKMDALSSQANLAGYVAVILAADRLHQVLPMMMTPAGTLKPARALIIGCGVAGLQAIATAKRLGARVEAFDTRPVVEEQVQSLGARFVKLDLGEMGETDQGYAKGLNEAQQRKQQEGLARVVSQADIVITTAQVFGRPAPRIITAEMVRGMRPGSIIVDLAADSGGNVEGTRAGEEVLVDGVHILGLRNLPGRVPMHASQMYAANLCSLIEHFWDHDQQAMHLNLDDEIIDSCLILHEGELRNAMIRNSREHCHA